MFENIDNGLSSISKGAFLTSGSGANCNIMTIAWGYFGFMWRQPVFIVPVRESRFTKEFIDKTGKFAISVPREGDMKDLIKLCGTVSGRDKNKIDEINTINAKYIDTLLVDGCEYYYECEVMAAVPLEKSMLTEEAQDFYKDNDYHTLFIGKILN